MSTSDKESTTNNHKQPNIQRRRVVQGAVLSTAAMAVPGIASAVCKHGADAVAKTNSAFDPNTMLTSDDVAIELLESDTSVKYGQLARVTITNKSHRPIKLSHVSPGAISTQKGVYQLNATLSQNPLSIRSGGTYQFWLTPDDGTQALLSTRPTPVAGEVSQSAALEVLVKTNLPTGPWIGTQRVQALIA